MRYFQLKSIIVLFRISNMGGPICLLIKHLKFHQHTLCIDIIDKQYKEQPEHCCFIISIIHDSKMILPYEQISATFVPQFHQLRHLR